MQPLVFLNFIYIIMTLKYISPAHTSTPNSRLIFCFSVLVLFFYYKILFYFFTTWFPFHFLNYILLIMLLQLSWFFPCCPSPSSIPYSLRQSPHHCSNPRVRCVSSLATPFPILHFTSPWPYCTYLFLLLNPLTSSYIPSNLHIIGQPSKCSLYPWFCLCSCLFSLFFRYNFW